MSKQYVIGTTAIAITSVYACVRLCAFHQRPHESLTACLGATAEASGVSSSLESTSLIDLFDSSL